jgi:hypothetical protein
VVDDPCLPGQLYGRAESQIGAGGAEAQLKLTALHNQATVPACERGQIRRDVERYARSRVASNATRAKPISLLTGRTTDATGSCR